MIKAVAFSVRSYRVTDLPISDAAQLVEQFVIGCVGPIEIDFDRRWLRLYSDRMQHGIAFQMNDNEIDSNKLCGYVADINDRHHGVHKGATSFVIREEPKPVSVVPSTMTVDVEFDAMLADDVTASAISVPDSIPPDTDNVDLQWLGLFPQRPAALPQPQIDKIDTDWDSAAA